MLSPEAAPWYRFLSGAGILFNKLYYPVVRTVIRIPPGKKEARVTPMKRLNLARRDESGTVMEMEVCNLEVEV